jgi:hypothetical protein
MRIMKRGQKNVLFKSAVDCSYYMLQGWPYINGTLVLSAEKIGASEGKKSCPSGKQTNIMKRYKKCII